jgi:hypothetical protein
VRACAQSEFTSLDSASAAAQPGIAKTRLYELRSARLGGMRFTPKPVAALIRAHVCLCALAYYLLWHFQERMAPLYVEQPEQIEAGELSPKKRRWTSQGVLESLKSLRSNRVQVAGTSFEQDSEPTEDQQRILGLLGVTLPRPKP